MLKGNKGEWSELYALFKLISDKELVIASHELSEVDKFIFPIIKILKYESKGTFEYSYDSDIVIIKSGQGEVFRKNINEFQFQSLQLLKKIKQEKGVFSIPEIEEFISSINIKSIKTSSQIKSDLNIIIYDPITGSNSQLGFSIKSQVGESSTLFNSSKSTNFIFEIIGYEFSDDEVLQINKIKGSKSKISKIKEKNIQLKFVKCQNETFQNNLTLIDSLMPKILGELIRLFFETPLNKSEDLVRQLAEENTLKFDSSSNHPFYEYKFKRFLTDVAVGMRPNTVWQGKFDATGGFIVVKNTGELHCYHLLNRNLYEDFLFLNTKFDTPSSRNEYGEVYRENEKYFIKLNIQIRYV